MRPMERPDVERVVAIERAAFPGPWSERVFSEEVDADGRVWLVAEVDGRVVGFAGLMLVAEEAHVLNMGVDPEWWGLGVGKVLLAELMRRGVALGARRFTLEVAQDNLRARALYREAGFRRRGVRPGYYDESGQDALVLWTGDLAAEASEGFAAFCERADAAKKALEEGVAGEPAAVAARQGHGGFRKDDALILGIETSCDETAAAVVKGGREILSDVVASQVDFHSRFGGVVPEIASRKHIEAITGVVEEALEDAGVTHKDLDAIAVTYGPGLVGALVVGVSYAKGLAMATGLPLVGVNHLEGHIVAAALDDPSVEPPLVALVVSGGHTSLVFVPEWGRYEVLGQTLDDAAGEAFDKVAKYMGLGYPGGPVISRLAAEGDPEAVDFPRALMDSGDYAFSLSGLKTAVITYIEGERAAGREPDKADVAASFQRAVVDVQVAKTLRAAEEAGVETIVLAGGVAANPELRGRLGAAAAEQGVHLAVPPPRLCTDNAVMVAAAAHARLATGPILGLDAEPVPDLTLG